MMNTVYNKGLHILATIHTSNIALLQNGEVFLTELNNKITVLDLHNLHAHLHHFDGGGYTGIVCLTESHIAFHTWPEFQLLTLDIYLSNFMRDNSEKARTLADFCANFFEANKVDLQEVFR